jgi:hypothetical protein
VLKEFADYITYTLPKLELTSHLGDALNFFIYDTLKIFKNFSLYSRRFSGALLTLAGLYIGIVNF